MWVIVWGKVWAVGNGHIIFVVWKKKNDSDLIGLTKMSSHAWSPDLATGVKALASAGVCVILKKKCIWLVSIHHVMWQQ